MSETPEVSTDVTPGVSSDELTPAVAGDMAAIDIASSLKQDDVPVAKRDVVFGIDDLSVTLRHEPRSAAMSRSTSTRT